jgi:hypothetical protein
MDAQRLANAADTEESADTDKDSIRDYRST